MITSFFRTGFCITSAACLALTAAADSPWFKGYLNSTNSYRIYAFTDWDTPLFGDGIDPDSDCLGVPAPNYRVDGHVVLAADGTGNCVVIEATGSYSSWLGGVYPISFQFSGWWCNPASTPPSDIRHDYDSEFLNMVGDPVNFSSTNFPPLPATIKWTGSAVTVSWPSDTNHNYKVMWTPQLTTPNIWYFLGGSATGNGLTNTVQDSADGSSRFYRIINLP